MENKDFLRSKTPFKKQEIFEDEPMIKEIIEKEYIIDTPKTKIARVVQRQNIVNSPGGALLGTHPMGEVEIFEERDGWVRVLRGWIEKRFLEVK